MKLVHRFLLIAAGFTSTICHGAESHKTFKALVNFGELEEIGETHGQYQVKTSDKTAPIEIIRDPSSPTIDYSIETARSLGGIDYSSLAILRERAADNFGFLQADVDVRTSSACKFRQVVYGEIAFLETVSKYIFTIALEKGSEPVRLESSIIKREVSAQCQTL
jgi:hypothetical protein